MSIFTRRMVKATAAVLSGDMQKVVKAILNMNAVDFVKLELPKEKMDRLSAYVPKYTSSELKELRERVENMLRQAALPIPQLNTGDMESYKEAQPERIKKYLDKLSISIQSLKDKQKEVNKKKLVEEELLRYAEEGRREYLALLRADADLKQLKKAISFHVAIKENNGYSLIAASSSEKLFLMDALKSASISYTACKAEDMGDAITALKDSYSEYEEELKSISEDVQKMAEEGKTELYEMWKSIRATELVDYASSFFRLSENTAIFSGWLLESEAKRFEEALDKATKGRYQIEWVKMEDVKKGDIPVSLTSPKFFKPFEKIVTNYGTPEYGSINPTPFTMAAFMLMFLLMFADLGQGFVLLLIGILGLRGYKKDPLKKDGIISRYLCSLLLYLGPASMLGGLIFGSCFGYAWIPPLWFDYHSVVNGHGGAGLIQDIYDILGITIKFGICIIYMGLILNWINLFKKKRYVELVFDKYGLVGGLLYGVGIWVGFGFVASGYKTFPTSPLLIPLIAFGLVLVVFKVPVEYLHHRKHGGEKKGIGGLVIDTVMEVIVQVLEIFSGFLANTLSFMRVAGLGIAHVSLMTAFMDMSALTDNILFKVLIMIIGNLLVIAIEGLSAGIQSLRLNYYEFFTKYFTGRGLAFSPMGLSSQIPA